MCVLGAFMKYKPLSDDELPQKLKNVINPKLQQYIKKPPGVGMAVIYAQISPSKKVYVGQHKHGREGKSFSKTRMDKTKTREKRAPPPISKAFVKYGFNNIRNFILAHVPECESDDCEKFFISQNGLDTMTPNGYNIKSGGANGTFSEEGLLVLSTAIKKSWAQGTRRASRKKTDALPEVKKRRSDSLKTDEYKAKMKIINNSDVVKTNRSNAMKEVRNRPETIEKYTATYSDPEWKKKHSIRQKTCLGTASYRANRKATDSTPETIKKRKDAMPRRSETRQKNLILKDAKKWIPMFAACATEKECMELADKYEKLVKNRTANREYQQRKAAKRCAE